MGQHCGQLSSIVMDSVSHGQRWIHEMLSRYIKHGSENMHTNVFTIGISGISWSKKDKQ
jgi:hypothetical protein